MPGLEDKQLPNIPKENDSLGGDTGLEGIPIPPNGQITNPTFTEFADGNDAILVRVENGLQKQYEIYIEDLIKNGEISANVDVLPGDIIVIPETWF